jgi:hypothetical protein
MNINDHKETAAKLEQNVSKLMGGFDDVLKQFGFTEFKVISFSIGPRSEATKMLSFIGSPCPTKCRVLPDGQIECGPDCS